MHLFLDLSKALRISLLFVHQRGFLDLRGVVHIGLLGSYPRLSANDNIVIQIVIFNGNLPGKFVRHLAQLIAGP